MSTHFAKGSDCKGGWSSVESRFSIITNCTLQWQFTAKLNDPGRPASLHVLAGYSTSHPDETSIWYDGLLLGIGTLNLLRKLTLLPFLKALAFLGRSEWLNSHDTPRFSQKCARLAKRQSRKRTTAIATSPSQVQN